MGTLIVLPNREAGAAKAVEKAVHCEIVIFPGVRIERHSAPEDEPKSRRRSPGRRQKQAS